MKNRFAVSGVRAVLLRGPAALALSAAALGATGCLSTTRVVQKTQAPDVVKTLTVEELDKDLAERDAAIKTLSEQVMVTATTGGSKTGKVTEYTSFKGYLFVQKPGMLRVILQLPLLGSRAMDMVSDGTVFTLMRKDSHLNTTWTQGANIVKTPSKNGLENLRPPVFLESLLVPGVTADEYVALTESSRVTQEETRHQEAIEEPAYDLSVSTLRAGRVLQRERVVRISRLSGLPFQQDIYDAGGQIVTQALYSNYQLSGGQQVPMTVVIRRPLEEYSLKIDVSKVTVNETFPADQFELVIPPGATVKKLD